MITNSLVWVHITAGAIGLLSGTIALSAKKGSLLHRFVGKAFFISMSVMSLWGSWLAFNKPEMISVLNGLLTFYLVSTSWLTVKPNVSGIVYYEVGNFILILFVSLGLIYFGFEALNSADGLKDGFPAAIFFIFATVATFAMAMDFRMIVGGGVVGVHRLVRHLWRMNFAMFIAVASFFLGQMQVFPEFIRQSNTLFIPVLIIIGVSFYWPFRLLFMRSFKVA